MHITILRHGFRYQIHYQIYREQVLRQESTPVIVFWHGFLGNGTDFAHVINYLPESIPCITLDLPGHGATEIDLVNSNFINGIREPMPLHLGYTMPCVAEVLKQFLIHLETDLGIQQIILVGYSLGGRLALYFARKFTSYSRNYIKCLVLESASPGLQSLRQQQLRQQKDLALIQELMNLNSADLSNFIDQWYSQELFTTLRAHPEFAKLKEQRIRQNPEQLALSLRGLGVGWQASLWKHLPEIKLPVWLLVGDRDQKFCLINQEMKEHLPDGNLVYLENCGHNGHYEQPQQFAQILTQLCQL